MENVNYPFLDKNYYYDEIMEKDKEDRRFYENFYIWSINNRSKILFILIILFILSFVIENIFDNNKYIQNNDKTEITGGKPNKNIAGKKNSADKSDYQIKREAQMGEGNFLKQTRDAIAFFPLIDKFMKHVWYYIIYSRVGWVFALLILIYGFGLVVVPLIILFLIIKYSLRIYKQKAKPLSDLYNWKNKQK